MQAILRSAAAERPVFAWCGLKAQLKGMAGFLGVLDASGPVDHSVELKKSLENEIADLEAELQEMGGDASGS